MKTPMQKSTMPRLLEENDYLWGTIARKVFGLFYSPELSEFCWQLLLSLSRKLACILIASASHLMAIVLVCQKNYDKYPNLQD